MHRSGEWLLALVLLLLIFAVGIFIDSLTPKGSWDCDPETSEDSKEFIFQCAINNNAVGTCQRKAKFLYCERVYHERKEGE